MAVETVTKQKGTKTCKDCNANLAMSATKCQNCNSSNISKLRVVIRKTESTGEDAIAPDPTDDVETDSDEELDEEDFEPSDDDEEDEEEDDDEETEDSEDDDAEEDDEDEEEDPKVTKRIVRRPNRRVAKSETTADVNLDILLTALTVAEDISKAVSSDDDKSYEAAMVAFNNVCDEGIKSWASGDSISKESPEDKLKRLKEKLAALKAKAGADDSNDDDEDDVGKSEDIFKNLSPAAAAVLKKAQEIQERDESQKYESIAKSFGELSVSDEELGAALRHVANTDNKHFETIEKALKAAAEAQAQSDIFKSFGSGQPGPQSVSEDAQVTAIIKSIQEGNKNLTSEQAFAEALDRDPGLYERMISSSAK